MKQVNKNRISSVLNISAKGFILLLLALPYSVNAAQLDCQNLLKNIKGKTYEYIDMDDDPVSVEGSKFFNDYTYAVQTDLEVKSKNTLDGHLAYLNDAMDAIKNITEASVSVRRAKNGRCVVELESLINKEYFEVIGTMDSGDVLWLGNKNSSGGEIYFSLEKQPEEG